jgi:thiamine-phosphate pyrophosphorylase
MSEFTLPKLYPILDRSCVADLDGLARMAQIWLEAGVGILQYRNKSGGDRERLADARELARLAHSLNRREQVRLVMNDRADLCLAANFDGLHLGQDDLSPEGARSVVGAGRFIGLSCHNEAQIEAADATDADYLAIGPTFATRSKANPDPVVGLDRLRAIRKLTRKPLVAIGGIDRTNARCVLDAGADSVAVIRDLFEEPVKSIGDFLEILR